MRSSLVVLVIAAAATATGCKSKKSEDQPVDKAPATKPAAPADDSEATALAGKPKTRLELPALGLSLEVPDGSTVAPETRPDDAKRRAHVRQGNFKLNVAAVDEYSKPTFEKAKEVHRDDKLIEWITAEETPGGWVTFKHVHSSLHKGPRFEVEVRTTIAGKAWECFVSAPTRGLAELTLAACKTLR